MVSRTIRDRQCRLVQDFHKAGWITLGGYIDMPVRSSRGDQNEGTRRDEPSTNLIDMIDDLVVGSMARLLDQLPQPLACCDDFVEAELHRRLLGKERFVFGLLSMIQLFHVCTFNNPAPFHDSDLIRAPNSSG